MNDGERWIRVSDLFDQAVELPGSERHGFLDRECGEDPSIRAEVEEMLRAHEKAAGVLDRRVLTQVGRTLLSSVEKRFRTHEPVSETGMRIGEVLGPYELIAELGRGGMGTVYLGHDPRLDRSVAIKVLRRRVAGSREVQERFLAEARAASSLDHPNICTIYDIGWTREDDPFIAMAHYEGQTLDHHIENGPMSSLQVVAIARQVASALQVAHESGIVHRDIKPSNLLLTPVGEIKMLDFGIAKLRRSASTWTRPGLPMGTPAYMSPEQGMGEDVDARSDLWSLGVVICELLTGIRPRRASPIDPVDWESILKLEDELENGRWTGILARLLAPDRRKRMSTASDLIEDLREWNEFLDPPSDHPLPLLAPADLDYGSGAASTVSPATGMKSVRTAGRRGLPAHLTAFIGRETELTRVAALLDEARLVTLLGPGGTGKTRLSVEVARRWHESRREPVDFVALAPVARAEEVPSAVERALGLQETTGDPVENIAASLEGRPTLLLLDNFEHVVGAAPFVSRLLAVCSQVQVLVTSRVLLRVEGEFAWSVPPLDLPSEDAPLTEASLQAAAATRLFLNRARATASDWTLDAAAVHAVREICARLDGLPLAIELAAARVAVFTPQTLLKRLERRLDLKSGSRDRPERHRTLRGAIAWSYELLGDEEKKFFCRLSALRGAFPVAAAEAMSEAPTPLDLEPLDGLETLVGESLLRRDRAGDGETRFVILETLREFGLERLRENGELDRVLEARALYVEALCRGAAGELTGSDQVRWFGRLQGQHDNVRVVIDRMIERDEGERALRLLSAIWRFWLARGYVLEGVKRGEAVLNLPTAQAANQVRAEALHGIGTLMHNAGDNEASRLQLEESLRIWRDVGTPTQVADALSNLGWVAAMVNDFHQAQTLSLEALAIQEEQNSDRGVAVARNNLGWVAYYRGRAEDARKHHEASLELRRKVGDRRGTSFALSCLGLSAQIAQRLTEADQRVSESEAILEEVGDRLLLSLAQLVRGRIALDRGEFDKAESVLEESVANWEAVGVRSGIAWAKDSYAEVLIRTGRLDAAEVQVEEALRLWDKLGARCFRARSVRLQWLIEMMRGPADDFSRLGGLQKTLRELVEVFEETSDQLSLAQAEEMFAVYFYEREPEESARRLFRARRLRKANGTPLPASRIAHVEEVDREIRVRLGDVVYERVRNQKEAP